jgi:hypothetical protein
MQLLPIKLEPVVRYHSDALMYLNSLIDILFEQDYFGFKENALQYVSDMKEYVEKHISFLSKYSAPPYFNKYHADMSYIMYMPNKRTTWYLFFIQEENNYLILYITNNHFEGRFIR